MIAGETMFGSARLPHVSTVSRALIRADRTAVAEAQRLNRSLVLDRLQHEAPAQLTLGFDGSTISSGRYAGELAGGYNAVPRDASTFQGA
jgi:hypothetical protein